MSSPAAVPELNEPLVLARKALAESPGDLQCHYDLMMVALDAEAWVEALGAAERFRALALQRRQAVPDVIRFTRGWILQKLGRHLEAVALFDELLAAHPGHRAGTVQRGVSLAILGKVDQARQAFRTTLAAHPGFTYASLNLADLEACLGNLGPARDALLKGLEASASDPVLLGRLVKVALNAADVDQAVRDAWEAIRRCPHGGEGGWHRLVGIFLLREGAIEEGRQVFGLGLEAFPGDPDLARMAASF